MSRRLTHAELLQLKRLNTPTIYNGWEQLTRHDPGREGFNIEEVHDFMPHMGAMIGYAITVKVQPGDKSRRTNPHGWVDYRRYVASIPGPKIVIVQDLDKPNSYGAFWGEVNGTVHKALGCVGTITDGAIRDLDEMTGIGFKALARRLCVGHAYSYPLEWDCKVEVFGRTIKPGQLIHADKHGFLAIPEGEEEGLLKVATFMDANECNTTIAAARDAQGKPVQQILAEIDEAASRFRAAVRERAEKELALKV